MRMRRRPSRAQADDADRRPAGAVARDALLRPLRAHRVHPLPRLRRAGREGLLPRLPGDRLQRLRADQGRRHVELLGTDISDWTITFVDTGIDTAIGERLRRVRPTSRTTRCSWPTTATCSPTPRWTRSSTSSAHRRGGPAARRQAPGLVPRRRDRRRRRVTGLVPVADMSMWINGGYFVLRQGIFDYLDEGEDLVMDGCVGPLRPTRGCWRSPTTGSGRRWTRSRSAARWRSCTHTAALGPGRRPQAPGDGVLGLSLARPPRRGPPRLLAVGAHADDIEIGCRALPSCAWSPEHPGLEVDWLVLSAATRPTEAADSAAAFLARRRGHQGDGRGLPGRRASRMTARPSRNCSSGSRRRSPPTWC